MEGKKAQESIEKSKVFQISIEDFENYCDTESFKEKKKEILELFTTYNNLRSEEEFNEIKSKLQKACREGDLEMIKIFLSETIEDSTNTLKFKIDKANQTASLFGVKKEVEELNIPRTVEHESTEYLITSIISTWNGVKTIKFFKDSAVNTFYNDAFSNSDIEEVYFPSSLKELKEGWCDGAKKLNKIIISPLNSQFEFKEGKYLVCKSEANKNEFDKLLFVRRDIKEFSIPSNIKIISSFAFSKCDLIKVEIPLDSKLQIIESGAFCDSCIESIFIPSTVSKICKFAFAFCTNLIKVEIPIDSNLQIIESSAFCDTGIESIFIPSKVLKICDSAFLDCFDLSKVEIPINSDLQIIESWAFSHSNIESIFIPSKVSKIGEGAFKECDNLLKVEIPTNSNLQTIGCGAFSFLDIKEIYIPANLKELKEGWCDGARKLNKIIISPLNSQFEFKEGKYLVCKSEANKNEFDKLLFVRNGITNFSIPSNIKIISSFAFSHYENLIKVKAPLDSELEIIGSNAFSYSNIESIFIPSKVSKICKYAFLCCNLIKVEIPTNSNLQTIESWAFSNSKIESIFIPSKVSKICDSSFSNCKNLQIIEISEESELNSLTLQIFEGSQQVKIMIPSSLIKLIK